MIKLKKTDSETTSKARLFFMGVALGFLMGFIIWGI